MGNKLFVGGLPWATDDAALAAAFGSHGNVTDAKVILDRETGRSRGFGFVTFASPGEAEAARQAMDGAEIQGRRVNVKIAEERAGGGGGGGPRRGPPGGRPETVRRPSTGGTRAPRPSQNSRPGGGYRDDRNRSAYKHDPYADDAPSEADFVPPPPPPDAEDWSEDRNRRKSGKKKKGGGDEPGGRRGGSKWDDGGKWEDDW